MLGYTLFILAVFLYLQKQYRFLSVLIFLNFISGFGGGFGLLTDIVIGAENTRLALFYVVIVLVLRCTYKADVEPNLRKRIILYAAYLFISIGVSLFYYAIPIRMIYNGILAYIQIFAVFLFVDLDEEDFLKIFRFLYILTLVTSVLFIIQAITGVTCLPYMIDDIKEGVFGMFRYYDIPPFLLFFTIFSFIYKSRVYPLVSVRFAQTIFLLADLFTFGRTYIVLTIICVIIVLLISNKGKKAQVLLISSVIIGIAYPFASAIFEARSANSEIAEIFRGNIDVEQEGATMAYRLGWIMERFLYMKHDIVQLLFGLGWYTNDKTPYHFILGLKDIKGNTTQLNTPDIAYGNFLSRLGLIGSVIYLSIVTYLLSYFYKNKSTGAIALTATIVIAEAFVEGLSGSAISDPNWLVFYLFIFCYIRKRTSYAQNINSNSNLQL